MTFPLLLCINNYEFTFSMASSRQQLLYFFSSQGIKCSLFDDEKDFPDSYMAITYHNVGSESKQGIGIMFNSGLGSPYFVSVKDSELILIAFNKITILFDCVNSNTIKTIEVGSPTFFVKCLKNSIVILADLHIYQITYSGDILNRLSYQSLIDDYFFDDSEGLHVTLENGEKHTICMT